MDMTRSSDLVCEVDSHCKYAESGMIVGEDKSDHIHGKARGDWSQIHIFAGSGDDLINLDFDVVEKRSNGHHVRGGDGRDIFDFSNVEQVRDTIVGRIEDFDFSRDIIAVDGHALDLYELPYWARIVEFNGAHNDFTTDTQQWIVIETGKGSIFYALEGARVDLDQNGLSNSGNQEFHFPRNIQEPGQLHTVRFIDQQNVVPEGYQPAGGLLINDVDNWKADVWEIIRGGSKDDLIAAGLNADTVYADSGNDTVWGGSGSDTLHLGRGNDTGIGNGGSDWIWGYRDDDKIYGREGNDILFGGLGSDRIAGGHGRDEIFGGQGDDRIFGGLGPDQLFGGSGDDRIFGGFGRDHLFGGQGDDTLIGESGADTFHFTLGMGDDLVRDFVSHQDSIAIHGMDFSTTLIREIAVQDDKDVFFDFGSRGSLTVLDVNLDDILSDIMFF